MTTKENMAGSLMLTKDSAPELIKSYFSKILELTQSGKGFPINLDDVYELVYTRRDTAIKELRKNFIEGDDYNLRQNAKVVKTSDLKNGVKIEAELSTQCMEYFIARRARNVFEVYRKVFHKAMNVQYEPKSITQETNIKEGEPYLQKFGKKTIYTVVYNGEPYFNLATIMRFIGYKHGSAPRYAKLIKKPMIHIVGENESPMFYMVNKDGVDTLLRLVPKDVDFYLLEILYKDLFEIELPNNNGEIYLYRFTAEEMLDILHSLNKRPINRNDVADLLSSGRRSS